MIALVFLAGSEVFAQGSFQPTGNLVSARYDHTATLLANGKVLVAGGYVGTSSGDTTALAELYDPVTRTWSRTGSMTQQRYRHTATRLPNGKVLVAGGNNGGSTFSSAELYDPDTGTWQVTAPMYSKRFFHTATLLTSGPNAGKVLVAGGGLSEVACVPGLTAAVELYDPSSESWSPTGSLGSPRSGHDATLLADGRVLLAGGTLDGVGCDTTPAASAELYDPIAGTWSPTGSMGTPRRSATLTVLSNGEVLAAGGNNTCCPVPGLPSAEVYDPISGIWITVGNMNGGRYAHTATLLWSGHILVAGGLGFGGGAAHTSAELYDPVTSTWSTTGSMSTPRVLHTSTALADGDILVAGGLQDSGNVFTSSAELFSLIQVVTPVNIDIKPGSFPNSINARSRGRRPVAILTDGIFDATTVVPSTVRFGATGTEAAPAHAAQEDVDLDGDIDLILQFDIQATGIQCGHTRGFLTGETSVGQQIQGADSINTVGCR